MALRQVTDPVWMRGLRVRGFVRIVYTIGHILDGIFSNTASVLVVVIRRHGN